MGEQNKPRREKGTGALYLRTRQVPGEKDYEFYQAVLEVKTETGKRKRITGNGATKSLAQAKLQANINKFYQREAEGTVAVRRKKSSGMTVEEWLDAWYESLQYRRLSETVRRKYKGFYTHHIVPHIGHIPLADLHEDQLEELFGTTLVNKKKKINGVESDQPLLGNSARRNIYKTLNTALKRAVDKGLISRNPLALVQAPELKQDPDENVPSYAHIVLSLMKRMREDNYPDYCRFFFMLLGVRKAERVAISLTNIRGLKTKNPQLVISQQIARHEDGSGWYIKPATKNGKDRTLPLPEIFVEALNDYLKVRTAWTKSPNWKPKPEFEDLLFIHEDGSPITLNQDNTDWHKLLDHYGYPYFRSHLVRHVAATVLADQEPPVPFQVIQNMLGNGVAMTQYYARISAKQMKTPLTAYGETIADRVKKK